MLSATGAPDKRIVELAVAQMEAVRPAYRTLLAFYGPVFAAQADAAAHTDPPPIALDAADLAMRRESGFALIAPADFTVDKPAAVRLLAVIGRLAADTGERLAGTGRQLMRAMDEGLAVDDLFEDVGGASDGVGAIAGRWGVPAEMLSLLVYLAAVPSITAGARRLAASLAEAPAAFPPCPICGSDPVLGELDADGAMWLHCRFCWHRWQRPRIGCSFCANTAADSLSYFYSDPEPEYRVNHCRRCDRYLKVVDTRRLERYFYAPLEQVATLHLDMLAQQKGAAGGAAA